jgi:hypothetical protein
MRNLMRCTAMLVLLSAAACSPTEVVTDDESLIATISSPTLTLTNASSRTAYYFVIDAELAPLANWAVCTDPAQCSGVAARASIRVPVTAIAGYTPATREAIVYWWHLTQRSDGSYSASEIRSVGVRL